MRFLELKIPPPLVGLLCALAMWGLARLSPAWPAPAGVREFATACLVAAGLLVDLLGLLGFRAQRTTINPLAPQRSTSLVTGGIYRLTRNPMYLGMAALLLAWATWLWTPAALLGPLVFILYITRFQIQPEERMLQRLFGDAYVEYASRVRRWL